MNGRQDKLTAFEYTYNEMSVRTTTNKYIFDNKLDLNI